MGDLKKEEGVKSEGIHDKSLKKNSVVCLESSSINEKKEKISVVGFWSHTFPMYLIVLSLLFIGLTPFFYNGDKQISNIKSISYEQNAENDVVRGLESTSSIASIVRVAMESSKERIEAMKESYDRVFAVLTALGAILAFLGFKGVESFMSARGAAEETVERSRQALKEAELAKKQASDALEELHQFIQVEYPRNNTAEINVSHGLIMREMAAIYRSMADHLRKDISDFPEYRKSLHDGLKYLNKAIAHADKVEDVVMARALVTIGNIEARLGNYKNALEACKTVFEKYLSSDESAYYNAACYACILASEEEQKKSFIVAKEYSLMSLEYLAKSIDLHYENKTLASEDCDFEWFRTKEDLTYKTLVSGLG